MAALTVCDAGEKWLEDPAVGKPLIWKRQTSTIVGPTSDCLKPIHWTPSVIHIGGLGDLLY